jgi:hypothetical protein
LREKNHATRPHDKTAQQNRSKVEVLALLAREQVVIVLEGSVLNLSIIARIGQG